MTYNTFNEYQAEALSMSDYPRVSDNKTCRRVEDALQEADAPYDPFTVSDVIKAVLGHVPNGESLPVYPAMALCGEAGEFSEKVKKAWRDETPLDVPLALKELGDCLWYIAAAARDLGSSLEEVACLNIEKLHDRRIRGTLSGAGDNR